MITPPKKLLSLPIWPNGNRHVSVKPLTGGRSNEAYIATDGNLEYVVRFCHDIPVHHVNRDYEAMVSKASASAGFSPELVFYELDGDEGTMVFDFITAKTYDASDVIENLNPLTKRLRKFHRQMAQKVSGYARLFNVFHVISDYTATLQAGDSTYTSSLDHYTTMAKKLKATQVREHIIFGHNDLVPQNIMAKQDQDGEKIFFIDFEYAAFSTPLSDLANLASNAGFSATQDQQLLESYFNKKPTAKQLKAYSALKVALMLRETMWSMVSESHLDVAGVDYLQYTYECLEALDKQLDSYQTKYGKLFK